MKKRHRKAHRSPEKYTPVFGTPQREGGRLNGLERLERLDALPLSHSFHKLERLARKVAAIATQPSRIDRAPLTPHRTRRPDRLPPQRNSNKRSIYFGRIRETDDRIRRICPKRQERKQVLFALQVAGKSGSAPGRLRENGKRYRRTPDSNYSCNRR